jgi:hypothetical protein
MFSDNILRKVFYMSNSFQIDITPEPSALRLFQNMSYSPWFALGEFIDNSITSVIKVFAGDPTDPVTRKATSLYGENGRDYKLEINIEFKNDASDKSNNKIVVSDNAFGISQTDIQRAFKMGLPPLDSSRGLSKHGIGMKAASLWFGSVIKVVTYPIAESNGYELTIRISDANINPIVNVKTIAKQNPNQHGTSIEISDLKHNVATKSENKVLSKIKAYLPSIYRTFTGELTEDGIFRAPKHDPANGRVHTEISIGKKPEVEVLIYEEPKLYRGAYWEDTSGPHPSNLLPNTDSADSELWRCEFDFTVGPENKPVSGWFGIMEETSREVSGFYLHYRGKGIAGIDAGTKNKKAGLVLIAAAAAYKPRPIFGQEGSVKYNGLTGVIDMSAFGKSITTDQLQWSQEEEDEFIEKLLGHMKNPHRLSEEQLVSPYINYVKMAEQLRRRLSKAMKQEQKQSLSERIAELNSKADGKAVKPYKDDEELTVNTLGAVVEQTDFDPEANVHAVKTLYDDFGTPFVYRIHFLSEPLVSDFMYVSEVLAEGDDDEQVYDIYINEEHPFIAADATTTDAKNLLAKMLLTYVISHAELIGTRELGKAIVAWSKIVSNFQS